MAANITTLTDKTFDEEVKGSDQPVLVDFWAEWCGPCKTIAPVLEEIANEHVDSIRIAKLNVDDSPDVSMRYSVMSIPTLILFKDGEEAARLIGARPKGAIVEELSRHVSLGQGPAAGGTASLAG